jgi:hypothetical protein
MNVEIEAPHNFRKGLENTNFGQYLAIALKRNLETVYETSGVHPPRSYLFGKDSCADLP